MGKVEWGEGGGITQHSGLGYKVKYSKITNYHVEKKKDSRPFMMFW